MALLVIHGLIHLMGFMKEWKLAELKQLTDQTLVPLSEPMSRMLRPGRGFNFGMNPGIPTR